MPDDAPVTRTTLPFMTPSSQELEWSSPHSSGIDPGLQRRPRRRGRQVRQSRETVRTHCICSLHDIHNAIAGRTQAVGAEFLASQTAKRSEEHTSELQSREN